jgi:xanthine/CO dehydrogenase XdhC/CoxF family maturation factor
MLDDLPKFHDIAVPADWAARVRAPAGLFHGRSPEEIALSIISDVQKTIGAAA